MTTLSLVSSSLLFLLAASASYAGNTSHYTFNPETVKIRMTATVPPTPVTLRCRTEKGEATVKNMEIVDRFCLRFDIKSKEGGPLISPTKSVVLTSKDTSYGCLNWYKMIIDIANAHKTKTEIVCTADRESDFSWKPIS